MMSPRAKALKSAVQADAGCRARHPSPARTSNRPSLRSLQNGGAWSETVRGIEFHALLISSRPDADCERSPDL